MSNKIKRQLLILIKEGNERHGMDQGMNMQFYGLQLVNVSLAGIMMS